MATERQKFMYEQSCKDFQNLQEHIGDKIKVNYVQNGVSLMAVGTLKGVYPFQGIIYTGGKIPFVSKEKMIRQVSYRVEQPILAEDKTIKYQTGDFAPVYDRTYIIPSNAKVLTDLAKYKVAIMGAEQAKKDMPLIIKDNLRQDT